MAKLTLDRTYIFQGKFYGPGDAEVPDDLAQSLGAGDAPPPDVPIATPPTRTPRGKKKAGSDADPE